MNYNSSENIKLSRWLDRFLPQYLPNKGELIDIIELIAEATIPIRGLLEKGITSREIEYRMNLKDSINGTKNIFDEYQIHEDILTHSIILKALREGGVDFLFVASEEAEPVMGNGKFGITTDPVDGSSNVAVNRTVGTIVGIFNKEGEIIVGMYILYGIFTNLIIAINGKVAEFILDTSPYSMTFYHYVFHEYVVMPNVNEGGVMCLGGNSNQWSNKCKEYEKQLIDHNFKNRYSGSFVGDFHAIIYYGGVYAYFLQNNKAKIRLYYEWLPLAFIIKTLGGEFYIIGENDEKETIDTVKPLKKENVKEIHSSICGGLLGNKKAVDLF